jgi:hypothetical protein
MTSYLLDQVSKKQQLSEGFGKIYVLQKVRVKAANIIVVLVKV